MKTFRTLLAINALVVGLTTAGPGAAVLAAVGGVWLGLELASRK